MLLLKYVEYPNTLYIVYIKFQKYFMNTIVIKHSSVYYFLQIFQFSVGPNLLWIFLKSILLKLIMLNSIHGTKNKTKRYRIFYIYT